MRFLVKKEVFKEICHSGIAGAPWIVSAARNRSARARVEYLFQLYEQLTAPLLPVSKTKRAVSRV